MVQITSLRKNDKATRNLCRLYPSHILPTGIEQLHSIEELDVAYNCISNGEALSSLSFLPLLTKLSLEFNPLSYVKDYRLVVLRRVSASVNRKRVGFDFLFCRLVSVKCFCTFLVSVGRQATKRQ